MRTDAAGRTRISTNRLIGWSIGIAVALVIAISMVAASGTPDPTEADDPSMVTSVVNSSVIVFREGLEAILIVAALTASLLGAKQGYRRPIAQGVAWAFGATVLTWFVMQWVLGVVPISQDVLLALTGLIAVVVLLLVMNWFFHKVYWTDHISGLNKKKKDLVSASEDQEHAGGDMKYWGFVALGFTAVYREGFEVVLFLQNLQLKAGTAAVLWGVLLGLVATAIVGWITFVAHHKLPYKRMLVLTGVLLGAVLVVMVGGSARTMQDLGWIPTTPLGVAFPEWWARWFEVVPTVETLLLQALAFAFVVGSYYAAEWWSKEKKRRARAAAGTAAPELAADAARIAREAAPVAAREALPTPAEARAAVRAEDPEDVPSTVCGVPAQTLCGAPATTPVTVETLRTRGPKLPMPPSRVAPAFEPPAADPAAAPAPPRIRLDLPRPPLGPVLAGRAATAGDAPFAVPARSGRRAAPVIRPEVPRARASVSDDGPGGLALPRLPQLQSRLQSRWES